MISYNQLTYDVDDIMHTYLQQLTARLQTFTRTDVRYVTMGGFWLIAGRLVIMAVSLVVMVILANWLPQKEFGMYQFILSVINILVLLSLPGINASLTRSVARGNEASFIDAFRSRVRWGLLGSIGALGIGVWYILHDNSMLGISFATIALLFIIKEAGTTALYYWDGKKRFDTHTILRVLSTIFSSGLLIAAVLLTNNLLIILVVFFGASAIAGLALYLYTKSKLTNNNHDEQLVPYGKKLTWMLVAGSIANQIDTVIVWKFLGPVQVALYSIAYLPVSKLHEIVPIPSLALPKLSEQATTKERKKNIMYKFLQLMVLMLPVTVLAILAAPWIFKIIFPQYMDSVIYFQILSLTFLTIPFSLIGTVFVAEMHKVALYATRVVAPIIQIGALVIFVALFGTSGAVLAAVIGRFIKSALELFFFVRM